MNLLCPMAKEISNWGSLALFCTLFGPKRGVYRGTLTKLFLVINRT